ncbi:PREDICTED: nucleoside diphosphate-linked moiety X motif 19, mitochondrial [Ceratotherium simum simum]|uniref:Nucleoside diphosphate-linked moiety X motif 19, mitochondrial n=1 Tax=Ceratotherium simum simum TaxID=73337 RepID=A0ABM1DEJ7_CERSS|nr:PREDICTED: nucleoside diphosphate-linked moiety X motif 19, mitochondrial [Ceratotherium simum simum]
MAVCSSGDCSAVTRPGFALPFHRGRSWAPLSIPAPDASVLSGDDAAFFSGDCERQSLAGGCDSLCPARVSRGRTRALKEVLAGAGATPLSRREPVKDEQPGLTERPVPAPPGVRPARHGPPSSRPARPPGAGGSAPGSSHRARTRSPEAPPPGLAAWRARVRRDPRHFLRLCAHLDCTPDVWALHDWSAWLTPFTSPGGRRFDTAFFVCCLREPPPVCPDLAEVVAYQWSSPSEATECFVAEKIWLAPPQFYEIRRLENFASLSDLHKFCLDRALEGTERWLPITLLTADGRLQLLPGDELYLEDSDFLENLLSTEKKNEEIVKEGKKLHRIVIYSRHVYSIYVTVQSAYKHVYPKNYVVSKSRL